jgi:uncharacterized protein YdeI (YjbR/CyaY-like superfamily)
MIETEKFKKIEVKSRGELRGWLLNYHSQSESVWLVTYKKSVPDKYLSTAEVLDELLCFGWIDGIRRKLDENRTMQLISPRKTQHWAMTYKNKVKKLMDEGKMHASGLKCIERSKQEGLWDFMNDVDNLIIPRDLAERLSDNSEAELFFNGINDSSKRFVLRWLKLAKTEKTREHRIEKIFELSAKGEKLPGS